MIQESVVEKKVSAAAKETRKQIFIYLQKHVKENHGIRPTFDEIAIKFGLGKTTVNHHILNLALEGQVKWHFKDQRRTMRHLLVKGVHY